MDYFKGFQVEYSLYFKHKICKNNKKWEIVMEEEFKIKSMLVRTFLAIVICLAMFFFKFILKSKGDLAWSPEFHIRACSSVDRAPASDAGLS